MLAPGRPTGKGARATHRAAATGCTLHDASYCAALELTAHGVGATAAILAVLVRCGASQPSLAQATLADDDSSPGRMTSFQLLAPPSSTVTPPAGTASSVCPVQAVVFHTAEGEAVAWMWAPPAAHAAAHAAVLAAAAHTVRRALH